MELSSAAAAELDELGVRPLLPLAHVPASGGLLHLDPACPSADDEWYTLEVSALEVLSPGWACSCCSSSSQWQLHLPAEWWVLVDDLFELSYRLGRLGNILQHVEREYVPDLVSALAALRQEEDTSSPMASPILEPAFDELRSRWHSAVTSIRERLRSETSRARVFLDLGIAYDSGPLVAAFASTSAASSGSGPFRTLSVLTHVLPSAASQVGMEARCVVVLPLAAATSLSFGVRELLPAEGVPESVLEVALKLWDTDTSGPFFSPRAAWEAALALSALEG